MAAGKDVLYLLLEQNTEVDKRDVYLADVAQMECTNAEALNRLKTIKILKIPPVKKFRKVQNVVDIITEVQKLYPGMEVQNLGETDYIITYVKDGKNHPVLDAVKTAVICVIIFFGSAFSIMTFNNDVDVPGLFGQIYEQITGTASDGFRVLELSYCVGLSIGILVFFNHIMGKKITMDPTPIEVQMKIYEEDINTALIKESNRKGKGTHGSKNTSDGTDGV